MTGGVFEQAEISAPDGLVESFPEARFVVGPRTASELADILRVASERRLHVLVWGGGTHQGYGYPVAPDVVVATSNLNRLVAWEPEDLTIVVESGMTVDSLRRRLGEAGQWAVLPENAAAATVGGVVASGLSGYRRLRYGPTRDRILQVTLVTGDGRVVTAGGRVVKNVTGYDISRLAAGSLGSLGVIASVCLKLWPEPESAGTVPVDDPVAAFATAYRPLAVIETEVGARVYLAGTEAEVEGQAAKLGSSVVPGLRWPSPLIQPSIFVVRVPPPATREALVRLADVGDGLGFRAAHGVGEIEAGVDTIDPGGFAALRAWAEENGGSVVVARAGEGDGIDPWGESPASLELQRRVKQAFDPAGVMNPGRLPGRL